MADTSYAYIGPINPIVPTSKLSGITFASSAYAEISWPIKPTTGAETATEIQYQITISNVSPSRYMGKCGTGANDCYKLNSITVTCPNNKEFIKVDNATNLTFSNSGTSSTKTLTIRCGKPSNGYTEQQWEDQKTKTEIVTISLEFVDNSNASIKVTKKIFLQVHPASENLQGQEIQGMVIGDNQFWIHDKNSLTQADFFKTLAEIMGVDTSTFNPEFATADEITTLKERLENTINQGFADQDIRFTKKLNNQFQLLKSRLSGAIAGSQKDLQGLYDQNTKSLVLSVVASSGVQGS